MEQLTHRELMLLQDNISMCQETTQFLQGCINMVTDPQLKNMCQQMVQEHKQDAQTLSRHITQTNIQ
jgi:rubrerythrin